MSLIIHPDPQHQAGGFAFLELPGGSLPDGSVSVAIFDAFGERWLSPSKTKSDQIEIGNANWQTDKVDFGPYDVHQHDGADWVRIGPEIVNKLEEYAPLRIIVAGKEFAVVWPDTVSPRAGAAVLGGLRPIARKQSGGNTEQLVGKLRAEDEIKEPEVPDPVGEPLPEFEIEEIAPRTGSLIFPLGVLMALLLAMLGVWYYWQQSSSDNAGNEQCSLATLAAITGGFEKTEAAIRECGANISPDTALRLVEEAAAKEDPEALFLFGTLYDGAQFDPRIEKLIGLTFEDDPAQAVEYYARAAKAGSVKAQSRLVTVCELLPVSNSTLAKGAYDDFCQ